MDSSQILQEMLDDTAAAVMTDDFDRYRARISLPCHIVSHDENKVVLTDDDLRAGFVQWRELLRSQRVTDYIRLVESAARLDQTLISGKYVSHILAGGQRVMPPFKTQIILRLEGNQWRAASITNGLANSRWPLVRLAVHPDAEDPKGSE
jgi:tRNA(His) 5'-end guanylyltransferase